MKLNLYIDMILTSPLRIILVLYLLLAMPLHAEFKIVERSSDKTPDWMLHHPHDYLVCMSEGQTMAEAQQLLLQEILRQIAGAVATHVESEVVADMGKEGDREWDNFRNTITATIANLPYISDVTLAKCKDIYWDHAIDKAKGVETYRMTALYPFDTSMRQTLINQYETYNATLEDTLDKLERNWKLVSSSVELDKAESELEVLSKSFPDANRRMRCQQASKLYRGIRKSLSLEAEVIAEGLCKVRVLRGDLLFHIEGRLDVSSDCASDIKVTKDPEGWTVKFDTSDCIKDEPNSLKITLRDKGTRLKTSVSF